MPQLSPLLVLVGPTAVGKTAMAILLAERLNGEIVTADSMQVYRGLDVGTAKPSLALQRQIPHHCIDLVDVGTRFHVAEYQKHAEKVISEIHGRGRLPILAGGTGLYIRAVVDDVLFPDKGAVPRIRQELEVETSVRGKTALYEELRQVDPAAAAKLHPNDVRRVVRALEVYRSTGVPISVQQERGRTTQDGTPKIPKYEAAFVGLTRPRHILYRLIDERVEEQLRTGLLDEARRLMTQHLDPQDTALQALGYKELFAYLRGECTLEEAAEILKRDTRRYAKRQFTWFRRDPRIWWVDLEGYDSLEQAADVIADRVRRRFLGRGE